MSKSRSTLAALTLLLATGAGCFGLGGEKAPPPATGGLWLSENSGSTWTSKSTLPTATGTASIDGLDILSIEQDPADASTMYVGTKTSGLFYTLDGGESWLRPEEQLAASGSVIAIEVDPRNVCTYYVLKSDRVIKTTTCGREFDVETYVETRTDESLTSMVLDWYNPNTLLIGTTQGDVLRSLDGGATWAATMHTKGRIANITISNADSRIVLAATSNRGIFRSTDGGATWVDVTDAIKTFNDAENIYDFSQTADGSRLLMSSQFGLLSSSDFGLTWAAIPLVTEAGEVTVNAMEVSPDDQNVMYYSAGNIFYTSTSGGSAWATTNLPSTRIASVIHVDEADATRLLLGVLAIED
jgi:photosystem II stability/assembly factor-like uncharacterized protein